MTSKEALKEIKQAPTFMGGNPRYMYSTQSSEPFLEDIKVIEKDLELLEILKKYTTIQQHTHNVWFDNEFFINGKKCSEKEYEMVRESLENGK